jgi:uncharacterized membrane protein (Fun14 family)
MDAWTDSHSHFLSLFLLFYIITGLGFMTLQALSYAGYVQVDHVKIQEHFRDALDLNDDGAVDGKDRAILTERVMQVLQYNLPAGSGFTMGFLGGLRSG